VKLSAFKECDIRGLVDSEVTEELAYKVGRAIASLAGSTRAVVGGDVRISTPALKQAVVQGFIDSGCDVIDLGTISTPLFYFARQHLDIDCGVMVTASHNPASYNGFKITINAHPVTLEQMKRLLNCICLNDFLSGKGNYTELNLDKAYKDFLLKAFPASDAHCKVVVDAGNGAYSLIAPEVFKAAGYSVVPLFCVPDGSFPNRSPNSASSENLTALSDLVIATGADMGVGFDGDGDRVSFVDETGTFVPSDVMIALLAQAVLENNPNRAIVFDQKCSQIVPETIEKASGIPIIEKSGHTFIKTRMISEQAIFGGEVSGHYFFESLHGGDDGLYSALFVGRLLSQGTATLSQRAASIPRYTTLPDIRIPFDGNSKELLDNIEAGLDGTATILKLDGIRALFEEGWGLVRASVTEPAITFRFEAYRPENLALIIERFAKSLPPKLRMKLEEKIEHLSLIDEEVDE
jgi:phosphomannomutase/phosphoglucomutase